MAYKYQTVAELHYASYCDLQMVGFALANGKKRYDMVYYTSRKSVIENWAK